MMQTIQFNAEEVVPHSAPMVLIDRITHYEGKACVSEVDISKDSMFAENSGVPSWVGIEYMAQTIAAHAGIQGRLAEQPPKIGFLVSSRAYEPVLALFPLGETLQVEVIETYVDNGLGVYDCTISLKERLLVKAVLNVFQPEDASQFLQSMNP